MCEVQQGGQRVWRRVTQRRIVGDEVREMRSVGAGVDHTGPVQAIGRL